MFEVSIRPMVEVQAHQVNGRINRHAFTRCGWEKPS
jgi:hypothetical protein